MVVRRGGAQRDATTVVTKVPEPNPAACWLLLEQPQHFTPCHLSCASSRAKDASDIPPSSRSKSIPATDGKGRGITALVIPQAPSLSEQGTPAFKSGSQRAPRQMLQGRAP